MVLRNAFAELAVDRPSAGGSAHAVSSAISRLRREFTNLTDPDWDLVVPASMTAAVNAAGQLVVGMGTTAGAEATLTSRRSFIAPFRLMVSEQLSQKIANNEAYIEVVAENPDGTLDETTVAAWRIAGSVSTTTTHAEHQVRNGGADRLSLNVAVSVSTTGTTAGALWEIELGSTECWFHLRSTDGTAVRHNSFVRHATVPDPTRRYRVRLRWRNGATAPASATTAYVGHVAISDYTEVDVTVTGSRGSNTQAQSLPVVATGGTVSLGSLPPYNGEIQESVTALAAGATYTGPARDDTGDLSRVRTRIRAAVRHTAGQEPGLLIFEQSPDNVTYRETWRSPVPSDDTVHVFEVPLINRFHRWRFVNGPVAQSAFFLWTRRTAMEGPVEASRVLPFLLTPPAGQGLAASTVYTGPTLDLGRDHGWDVARLQVASDVASGSNGIAVQQSHDGATWFSTSATTLGGAGAVQIDQPVGARYMRAFVLNGATAATALRVALTLLAR